MNEATRKFIEEHRKEDVRALALQTVQDPSVDLPFALNQIKGWQTARKKIPSWAAADGILFPVHLSMEQCSGEQTAVYKQQLCSRLLKNTGGQQETTLVDLTGGFGVDCSFMARCFSQSCYVERQQALCELAENNFPLLQLDKVKVVCADAEDYLNMCPPVTMFFLDPARRDDHGGRTYAITDCTPDVLAMKDMLLEKADYLLLKLSPMLDWHHTVQLLGDVLEVHIVSVDNECKELLVLLSKKFKKEMQLYCVDDGKVFCPTQNKAFNLQKQSISSGDYAKWYYLYEPNASVMNAGCFDALSRCFSVAQIAANSHLFVSDKPIAEFPGRQFEILEISTMNKKELRGFLSDFSQANLAVRNFPMSVAELRKRLHLKEGGEYYLFATTTHDRQHILLKTRKVRSL
ncbi:MAG: SAM-dependent methyltransferase [Prevotella sp.]|nr:SAM-dependent methyltransferase [Prevotella sp.]